MEGVKDLFTLKIMKCPVCEQDSRTMVNGLGMSSSPVESLMCLNCYVRALKWAAAQALKAEPIPEEAADNHEDFRGGKHGKV